jgi:hypothetical protein
MADSQVTRGDADGLAEFLPDLAVGAGEGEVVEFFQRIPFAEFGRE